MSLYYSDANKNLHKVAGNFYLPDNVERVETIYDKDSDDSNINLNHINGIKSEEVIKMDLSKYKLIRVYASLYDNPNYISCNRNTCVLLDLKDNRVTRNNETLSLTTNRFAYFTGSSFNITQPFDVVYIYSHTNKTFTPLLAYDGQSIINDTYYVYKIEGIY